MNFAKPVLMLACAAALSGCVVAPYHPRHPYYGPPGSGAETDAPPPPTQVEVIPIIPFIGALWIAGHWGWQGGRHHWVGGRWVAPRPGYHWHPHRWDHSGGRWRERGGGWQRR